MTKPIQNQIPEGWKLISLGEIGKFRKGKGVSKAEVVEEGCNAIRYGEIYTSHNFIVKRILSHISKETALESLPINKNDIVFAGSGETIEDIGKSVVYMFDAPCYAGGDTIIFSPKNDNGVYLSYALNVGNSRRELNRRGQGHSVVHIYSKELQKLPFLLPPLPEQKRIVYVLETWDKYLELLDRKILVKKNIKKGLMQRLLSGEMRLPGFSGEWKEVKLREIIQYKNGGSFEQNISKNGKYFLITLNSIDIDGKLKKKHKTVNEADWYLCKDDLVIVLSDIAHGYFLGLVDRIPKDETYVLNQRMGMLRKKVDFINIEFVRAYLNIKRNYFKRHGQGSSQQNLSKGDILTFRINIPSLDEQSAIADILSSADEDIRLLEEKRKIIAEQKKFLLNNLITGKIRIL